MPHDAKRRPAWEPDGAQDPPAKAITDQRTKPYGPEPLVTLLDRIADELHGQRAELRRIAESVERFAECVTYEDLGGRVLVGRFGFDAAGFKRVSS